MTRPADRFVAAAFWECAAKIDALDSTPDDDLTFVEKVRARSEQLEAIALAHDSRAYALAMEKEQAYDLAWLARRKAEAGGADRQCEEVMQPERASDKHPVASAAECETAARYVPASGKVACPIPTCRAEMLPGKTCGGVNCGLRGEGMKTIPYEEIEAQMSPELRAMIDARYAVLLAEIEECPHPGCATPTTPEPCGYAACPRR